MAQLDKEGFPVFVTRKGFYLEGDGKDLEEMPPIKVQWIFDDEGGISIGKAIIAKVGHA